MSHTFPKSRHQTSGAKEKYHVLELGSRPDLRNANKAVNAAEMMRRLAQQMSRPGSKRSFSEDVRGEAHDIHGSTTLAQPRKFAICEIFLVCRGDVSHAEETREGGR